MGNGGREEGGREGKREKQLEGHSVVMPVNAVEVSSANVLLLLSGLLYSYELFYSEYMAIFTIQ